MNQMAHEAFLNLTSVVSRNFCPCGNVDGSGGGLLLENLLRLFPSVEDSGYALSLSSVKGRDLGRLEVQ